MRPIVSVYLVIIHVMVVYLLWDTYRPQSIAAKSQPRLQVNKHIEFTHHYSLMLGYHLRSVKLVPEDAVIFIGDSMVQGLCVNAVYPLSINYGIGSDTTAGVLARILYYYPAIQSSRGVILAVGTNDHKFRSVADTLTNIGQILDSIPPDIPVMLSSVMPVDESKQAHLAGRADFIAELNKGLKDTAEQRAMVIFVDNDETFDADGDNRLDDSYHAGDGIHLNRVGNEKWVENLRAGLALLPTL